MAYAEQEVLPLLKEKVCMSCHVLDKKRVGPSLMMIAERYQKDQKMTAEILAKRIQTGGKGMWGPIFMPTQNALSDADAIVIAQWILDLAEPRASKQAETTTSSDETTKPDSADEAVSELAKSNSVDESALSERAEGVVKSESVGETTGGEAESAQAKP